MYSFRPEPEPAEREALVLALHRLLETDRRSGGYRSEWRRAALEEGVSADEDEEPAG
jgi:hypothetical protein